MKIFKFTAAVFVASLSASAAPVSAISSFCMSPRAPTFYNSKPNKPFCAAMRNCSSYDISNYKQDVSSYFSSLRFYADEVDRHYKKQIEYIECLSELD